MTAKPLTRDQLGTVRFMRGKGQRIAMIARVFGFGTVDGLVDAILATTIPPESDATLATVLRYSAAAVTCGELSADRLAYAGDASLAAVPWSIHETAPSGVPAAGNSVVQPPDAGTAAAIDRATGQPCDRADDVPPLREAGEGVRVPEPANTIGQSARPTYSPKRRPGRPLGSKNTGKPIRRFASHAALDPDRQQAALGESHPALAEARTVFPTTVVDSAEAGRLLVSGANQRKLGDRIIKGPWKGLPIYSLTLEERATCPPSCALWRECFGNAMPFARRHRHGDELIRLLHAELWTLHHQHKRGFAVRLHVLGDFWSLGYVQAWRTWLRDHPGLHVFGFTAWLPEFERGIGSAVAALNEEFPDRCAIRFSVPADTPPAPMQATTIWRLPDAARVDEGIVCPAQTGGTDCCGTCGLCWAPAARQHRIVFVGHGRKNRGPTHHEPKVTTEPAPDDRKPAPIAADTRPVPAEPVDAALGGAGVRAAREAGEDRRDSPCQATLPTRSGRSDHQPVAPPRRVGTPPRRSAIGTSRHDLAALADQAIRTKQVQVTRCPPAVGAETLGVEVDAATAEFHRRRYDETSAAVADECRQRVKRGRAKGKAS